MAFVDKPRNGLTSAPARKLNIGSGYFLTIETGFELVIQAAVAATNWTDKTRNT